MRSGVNCTRRNSRSRAAATALTTSVLATPGTPSRSTCPRTSSAATSPESVPSCPTTTFPTSSRRARIGPRTSLLASSTERASSTECLLANLVDLAGEGDECSLVEDRSIVDGEEHLLLGEVGAGRGDLRDDVRRGPRGQPV